MTRLADIEAHLGSMSELLGIVGAMRSLASMRMQEAHRSLAAVQRYAGTMVSAIGSALLLATERPLRSADRGRRALVVCTAEHGFVGGFNERILDVAERETRTDDRLMMLGTRGTLLARERGSSLAWTHPMATRYEAVTDIVRTLSSELYRLITGGSVTQATVVFARWRQRAAPSIELRPLFPVDLATFEAKRSRLPPLANLPPSVLLEKLVAEYVVALLTEAVLESLASENAARFAAMESARDNVSRKVEQLRRDARQARQGEITTELIDLVTGAEALHGAFSAAPARPSRA